MLGMLSFLKILRGRKIDRHYKLKMRLSDLGVALGRVT